MTDQRLTKVQRAAFRWMLLTMPRIDCMQCAMQYAKDFDVCIDWHEFAYELDFLYTKNILEVIGHSADGMTQYRFKAPISNETN